MRDAQVRIELGSANNFEENVPRIVIISAQQQAISKAMLRVERPVPYLVAPIEFGDIADRFAAMMMIDDEIRDVVDRHACLESAIHEFGVFGCAERSPGSEVLVE